MNNLRVFASGGCPHGEGQQQSDEDKFLAKQKHLRRIRVALFEWRGGSLPPRNWVVIGFAGLAYGLVFGLALVLGFFGVACNSLVVSALAIASGIAAGSYVSRHSNAPRTHADHLDRLLAAYEPVSKDIYRELQKKVKERGSMDGDLVEWWLELEGDALQVAAGWQMPSEGQFLKKKV